MLIDGSYRTTSTSEAEALIARVYDRPSIRDTSEPFLFRQRMRGDDRVNITRFQISAPALTAVDIDDVLGIGRLNSGKYEAESNGEPVDASGPFLLRPGEARCRTEALDLTMVNLDLPELSRFAVTHGYVSDGRLVFEPLTLDPGRARHWNGVLAHVMDLFDDPDLFETDLIRHTAVDLLYSAALTAFVRDTSASESTAASAPSLRRALQFIDDNAAQPIDLADIAAAARLSVRGLQAAFRRELATTPLARLRAVRLAHAHADLVAADPTTDSVAEIARRWGFAHLGRFAATYQDSYNVLPHRTLQG